jgi:hypothetical protein
LRLDKYQIRQVRKTTTGQTSSLRLWLALSLLLGAVTRAAQAEDPFEDLAYDLRPYKVRLIVAMDSAAKASIAQPSLTNPIGNLARLLIGEAWSLQIETTTRVDPLGARGLMQVAPEQWLQRAGIAVEQSERIDVWFMVSLQAAHPGYQIDVRSWQPEMQFVSEPVGQVVLDQRNLALEILKLCHLLFRPIGIVEDVAGDAVRVRLRAGALPVLDEALALVRPNDLFVPVIGFRNREQRLEKLQLIPWTYLAVTELEGSHANCHLESGLRSPIGGKKRGRVETLAMGLRPHRFNTRLQLMAQTKPPIPLAAHRIEVRKSSLIPNSDDSVAHREHLLKELITDRRGQVELSNAGDTPTIWLFVYSGKHLLARVPFAQGSIAETRLDVPDDEARLTAEANVQMLQEQLLDAVAIRATHFASMRVAARRSDWTEVRAGLDRIPQLPSVKTFEEKLAVIRVPAVNAAIARKDRASEARIMRLCNDMLELIRQYLNDDKSKQIVEEMKELLKTEVNTTPKENSR